MSSGGTVVETILAWIEAWRSVRQDPTAMTEDPHPAVQSFKPANQDHALYAVGTVSPQPDAVLALARLLGRQIAREEFQRSFAPANDHALRTETDQG